VRMRVPVEREPLSLRMAVEFATVFLVVNLAIGWVSGNYPGLVYLSALLGGLVSSTSVFASVSYLFVTGAIGAKAAVTCFSWRGLVPCAPRAPSSSGAQACVTRGSPSRSPRWCWRGWSVTPWHSLFARLLNPAP